MYVCMYVCMYVNDQLLDVSILDAYIPSLTGQTQKRVWQSSMLSPATPQLWLRPNQNQPCSLSYDILAEIMAESSDDNINFVIASSYGYSELKPQQRSVLIHFLSGKDVFGCLPTGYGKSLCYYFLKFLTCFISPMV